MTLTGFLDFSQTPYSAVNDGVTDNRAAWDQFVADCQAQNKAGYIPPGTYLVTRTAASKWPLITGSLRLVGAGRGLSRIKVGPTTTPQVGGFEFALMRVETTGVNITVRDLSIDGPTAYTGFPDLIPQNAALFTLYSANPGSGTNNYTFENVEVTGKFTQGINNSGRYDGTTKLINTDITTLGGALYEFEPGFSKTGRRVEITGGTFVGGQDGTVTSDGNTWDNTLYIHPHVSLVMGGNWRIGVNYRTGIAHFSASGAPGAPAPKEARLVDGTFEGTNQRAIITSAVAGAITLISGVVVRKGQVCPHGQTTMIGCTFEPEASWGITAADQQAAYDFMLIGTTVKRGASSPATSLDAEVSLLMQGGVVVAQDGVTTSSCLDVGGACPSSRFIGVRFASRYTTTQPQTVLQVSGSAGQAPKIDLVECVCEGLVSQAHVRVQGVDAAARVRAAGGRSISVYQNGTPAGVVELVEVADSYYANGTGQSIVCKRGTSASVLASAATLTLSSLNYDTWHVSGATTINTLYIVDSNTTLNAHGATVRLIADGAWALGTTGNILPVTTSPHVANDIVVLTYDHSLGKWRELG